MKNFMLLLDDFIKTFTWKEIGLIKVCVLGVAIPLGFLISKSCRKVAGYLSFFVFLVSYITIIWKFIRFINQRIEE